MGVVIRQSILTTILSYLGVAIGYINLLYLFPKFLAPEQVGLFRTIQDVALLFTPFAVMGLGSSIIKFFPHFASDKKLSHHFIILILTLGVFCFGLFILTFLLFQNYFISYFEEKSSHLLRYTSLILWLTFFLVFITLLEQYSRSLLNIALPAFLREVGIRILQGLLVTAYFIGWVTFNQFLLLSVLLYLFILIVLAAVLFQRAPRLSFNFKDLPKAKMKEIFTFSSLSFLGSAAMVLIGKMDSVMVSGMLGLASNAIYTTAFYMASIIEVPKRAITTTISAVLARAFEKEDISEVESIYKKTSLIQLIIGSLLLIGIWANLPNLFQLMPRGDYYQEGALVVLIIGCAKLVDMAFGPSSEIIGLSRHYYFNLVCVSILALGIIASNYFFIIRFGIIGAAYGSVIALTAYNVAKFFFIYFKWKIHPFTPATLKVLVISIVTVLVNFSLPTLDNAYGDTIFRSTIITLIFSTLVITTKCSKEINQLFLQILNRLGIKK